MWGGAWEREECWSAGSIATRLLVRYRFNSKGVEQTKFLFKRHQNRYVTRYNVSWQRGWDVTFMSDSSQHLNCCLTGSLSSEEKQGGVTVP